MDLSVQKKAGTRADQLQFLRFLAFLNVYICHAESWLFFKYPASHCAAAAVSFFFIAVLGFMFSILFIYEYLLLIYTTVPIPRITSGMTALIITV